MIPSALILSNDTRVLRIMQPAFQGAGVQIETVADTASAGKLLAQKKFEAVVVDCDDIPGAKDLLAGMRNVGITRDVVKFALLQGTSAREVNQYGAHFALEKPIERDATMKCIRAALSMMHMERRKYFRFAMESGITLRNGRGLMVKGTLSDIGANGAAAHLPAFDTASSGLQVLFSLPGSGAQVEGDVEIAWHHDAPSGVRAGIRFVKLAAPSRVSLEQWINTQEPDTSAPLFIHAPAAKKLTVF